MTDSTLPTMVPCKMTYQTLLSCPTKVKYVNTKILSILTLTSNLKMLGQIPQPQLASLTMAGTPAQPR